MYYDRQSHFTSDLMNCFALTNHSEIRSVNVFCKSLLSFLTVTPTPTGDCFALIYPVWLTGLWILTHLLTFLIYLLNIIMLLTGR